MYAQCLARRDVQAFDHFEGVHSVRVFSDGAIEPAEGD